MDQRIYAACLRHAARVLPGDPALEPEDLCQSAYLKTLGRLDPARSEHEQVRYLCVAVDQVAIDAGRRKRFDTAGDETAARLVADGRPGPEDVALAREAEDAVAAALLALGPTLGPAVALVDGAGLMYREAALALGVPKTTIVARLHRGRTLLRALLAPA